MGSSLGVPGNASVDRCDALPALHRAVRFASSGVSFYGQSYRERRILERTVDGHQGHWPLSCTYGMAGEAFDGLLLCANAARPGKFRRLGRRRGGIGFDSTGIVVVLVESHGVLPGLVCRNDVPARVES